MSGIELHNLQISVVQAPSVQKAQEDQAHSLPNQALHQANLSQAAQTAKRSVVQDLDQADGAEPEEEKKEQIKKKAKGDLGRVIDIKI